jgi:spoIIIJ-associated protein
MSDSREFHGASLEEALTRAAAVLNINESQLDYEVIDEGSTGFLGIGGRDARILVSNAGSSDNWVDSEKVVQEAFAQDTADPSPETDESVPDAATSEELPESDAAVSEPEMRSPGPQKKSRKRRWPGSRTTSKNYSPLLASRAA